MDEHASDAPFEGGLSPNLTPEQLAHLAADRPDLWGLIESHPSVYPDLRQWIAGRRAESQAPPLPRLPAAPEALAAPVVPAGFVAPEASVGPVAFGAVGAATDTADGVGAVRAPRAPRKRLAMIAGAVAVALALGGGAGALALTGTWPFGEDGPLGDSGGSDAQTAAEVEKITFENGVEEKWTVTGDDLGADLDGGAQLRGHLPRMMGPINQANRADQPIQLASGVLMHYWEQAPGDVPARWALLDPESGEPKWQEEGRGSPSFCATDDAGTEAVCNSAFVGESQLIGFDENGIVFDAEAEHGSVLFEDDALRLLSEEQIAEFDLEGRQGDVTPVSGVFAGTVGNARTPDCVWLYGAGTLSYAGPGCDAPTSEIITDADAFNWSVVGDEDPVLLIDDMQRVSAYDPATRELLWEVEGALPGWFQDPQVVRRDGEDRLLIAQSEGQNYRYSLIGIESGEVTEIDHSGNHPVGVVAADQVLIFDGDRASDGSRNSISRVEVFDGESGAELFSGEFPEIGNVAEITGGPLGAIIGHRLCTDCTTAEGSHVIDSYTFLGPVDTADAETAQAASVTIPDSIPYNCPADTILLAWAELPDGWVLVCGVTLDEPTFVAYQPSAKAKVVFSNGAKRPTGADAKASVNWDAKTKRYTAELSGGNKLTLDYDLGTLTVRDEADVKTVEQQRTVRYIFVPLGERIRTVDDSSEGEGTFSVQKPKDTAEDQIRYMIQVLEKAYDGRALVKDALPKLQYCTASAGGYTDTVAAMKAVRDNRAELLEALASMPVDKIPEGEALLDDLTEAIRVSHSANVEYVAWAEAANASGCASLSAAGQAAAAASDAPKERFAARWNRAVAPVHGVRTFDAWYI